MRGLFPAAFACAVALAACGGATERKRSQASAGAPNDSQPPPGPGPAACDCADVEIGWWVETGIAPPEVEARITPCNSFSYGPAGEPECRTVLDDCSQMFSITRLSAALAARDVQQALAQAPVVYGRDLRGLGGQVDHIEIGGKVIELGDECDALEPCPIPEGVSELANLLGRLAIEQQASCILE